MVNFLRKKFIKDYDNIKNQKVREAHGKLASIFGVVSNLILFTIKLLAGLFSKSVSIIADSVNNLSDMGSSVVTLIGFKMANKPADEDHPFGHQRVEYIAGLIVSIIIIFVGGTLLFSSVDKIINFEYIEIPDYISYISIGILCVSILIKLWQSLFNKKIGSIIDSVALKATAYDSRNDAISTFIILIGTVVVLFKGDLNFSLDGVLGILVSLFIIYSGIKLIKETTNPLIGNSISMEYVKEVVEFVKNGKKVLGVHDVVCHMYGPTKCFMTLHVEVDSRENIIEVHDNIDEIESQVREKYGVELTIHMDPLEIDNEETNRVRSLIAAILKRIDDKLNFHDFRIVRKLSKSTLLFDIVIPYKYSITEEELTNFINKEIEAMEEDYNLIINYDHQYIREEDDK